MPKFLKKKSRLKLLASNNLGITDSDWLADSGRSPIFRGDPGTQGGFDNLKSRYGASRRCRSLKLEMLDKYYNNTQYDHLPPWDEACGGEDYVKLRERRPRVIYGFGKVLASRTTSKLIGASMFPSLTIENEPDESEFIRAIIKAARLKSKLIEPVRQMCALGSSFVRFYIAGNAFRIKHYSSKYCYPEFNDLGELVQIEIKYVFKDQKDKDSRGNPKEKWYRMILGQNSEVIFDNPEYKEGVEPVFTIASKVDHNLGFVQGEWFRTSEEEHSPDGYSLIEDITDFIDELCYSLSQSSQAVQYNQEPQLILNGMDEDEIQALIRSSQKGWNLGKDGKAEFLETDLAGVETASNLRDKMRLGIQDITRVILLDPEKIVGSAQSGKAMEVLHGPFVELVNELRSVIEDHLVALVTKMAVALLLLEGEGFDNLPVTIPDGWAPDSLDITIAWPDIFPMTIEDLQKKVAVASQAKNSGIISPETAIRYIAKDFGVEDIEEELKKIDAALAAQAALNPFGGF